MARSQRIVLELSAEARKTMDKLMGMTEHKTEAEVIRRALTLYHYCLVESGLDGVIILKREGEDDKEIMIR